MEFTGFAELILNDSVFHGLGTLPHPADASSSPAPAIPLRPEEVPDDLTCSICFCIPTTPSILPGCEHLFCQSCIQQALEQQRSCPVCREDARSAQPLQRGLSLRLWSKIAVKCCHHAEGCTWTGSMADYKAHVERCQHPRNRQSFTERVETEHLNELVASLRKQLQDSKTKCTELKIEVEVLNQLMAAVDTGELPYSEYNRFNVPVLSRFISIHLENKPDHVSGQQIYICVQNIVNDYRRDYTDNPEDFFLDVRMLLAICLATCGWFTDRQRNRLQSWWTELF